MSDEITLTPVDGWGFDERVDGRLAPCFSVSVSEQGVDFGHGVLGWRASAINGKYAGAELKITPRSAPFSGTVVLEAFCQESNGLLFSGMAESNGLRANWGSKQ